MRKDSNDWCQEKSLIAEAEKDPEVRKIKMIRKVIGIVGWLCFGIGAFMSLISLVRLFIGIANESTMDQLDEPLKLQSLAIVLMAVAFVVLLCRSMVLRFERSKINEIVGRLTLGKQAIERQSSQTCEQTEEAPLVQSEQQTATSDCEKIQTINGEQKPHSTEDSVQRQPAGETDLGLRVRKVKRYILMDVALYALLLLFVVSLALPYFSFGEAKQGLVTFGMAHVFGVMDKDVTYFQGTFPGFFEQLFLGARISDSMIIIGVIIIFFMVFMAIFPVIISIFVIGQLYIKLSNFESAHEKIANHEVKLHHNEITKATKKDYLATIIKYCVVGIPAAILYVLLYFHLKSTGIATVSPMMLILPLLCIVGVVFCLMKRRKILSADPSIKKDLWYFTQYRMRIRAFDKTYRDETAEEDNHGTRQ